MTGTPTAEQDWALGNWSKFTIKAGVDTTLDQTRAVNEVNEITNVTNSVGMGWVTPEYDAAGNATKLPYPAIPTQLTTHIYDAWNRLVEVKFGTTITLERYEYDGLGRRIVRTIFPSTTNDVQHSYYNENWQELEVRREISGTESGNPYEQFVWHPYYIDALATRFYDSDVSDSGGVVQHYFTHDANFNITAALDTSGTVAERYDYTPYGKVTFLDASFAPLMTQESTIANSYLYTGRRLDATTGLYHYRHRYYDANIGIFTSRDPIGYDGEDENLYRYVGNDPILSTDPSGMRKVCCSFRKRDTIWSEPYECKSGSAINCCIARGSGVFNPWKVVHASEGPCNPPRTPPTPPPPPPRTGNSCPHPFNCQPLPPPGPAKGSQVHQGKNPGIFSTPYECFASCMPCNTGLQGCFTCCTYCGNDARYQFPIPNQRSVIGNMSKACLHSCNTREQMPKP